ncbi:uncharacterized protein PGTG_22667 [Puccinia graminis f. sp. tritici CRL 75-36-700-3]|uniref:Peptidase A2 domain-containing protein n=1 Tax=Puccinia graminis f. sp. tritici (strain CRL 75-36-700-3 / race SCCL) TaxID=418459 RepID=H6QV62_PUCGT|nr:uncharacterized protein PGTG_22667 [Puccinia graminis f. sp. tritici CRL 75-36-700-3]EHS62723.1 hypothetical protein PGTG_22667 [Puccinia graminis f. sp. tritici CRL 75-36-700-3]
MPVEKFIKRYENAGLADDASAQDLARQIISFIHGNDLKDEVEEMTGHEDSDWELLKKQLLNRFGSSLPLVKYSRQDLKRMVNTAIQAGGIKTLEEFKAFRTKFETITNYLTRMGYTTSLEEFRELLLESLSPDLESSVTKELIRDNKMLASKDGGDILPNTQVILTYIHREVQSASVMDRRKLYRMEPHREMANSPSSANPAPSSTPKDLPPAFRQTTPFNSGGLEQKVEELTRKFAALSAGKMVPPHLSGSTPYQSNPPAPRNPDFKCYYCFLNNHGTKKCNSLLYDESIGAVSRDGRDFKLPDSTTIPWDVSRPIKQVVDQFSRNSVNISSSFGQLQEVEAEEVGAYEVDLGKRTRSSKEEDTPASDKRSRKEKNTLMDMDEEDLLKMANPSNPSNPSNSSKPSSTPPPASPKSASQPNKVRFQEPSGQESAKEKPAKKTYLEKTLAKEYPGVEEETAKRMLMGGKLELSFGEIFAISSGVTDCFKKRISNKRVPVEEAISTHSGALDETDGEEDSITHYSCPLGYINLSVKGHEYQALLDTGSMVNLIPLGLA